MSFISCLFTTLIPYSDVGILYDRDRGPYLQRLGLGKRTDAATYSSSSKLTLNIN